MQDRNDTPEVDPQGAAPLPPVSAATEKSPTAADAEAGVEAAENLPTLADEEREELKQRIIGVLKTCYDPEIPVDIYQLGMIYGVDVKSDAHADIRMTLTSPSCPVAGTLPGEVERKVATTEGVRKAKVELVWEPAWTPDMMSDAAKLQLNML